MDGDRFPVAGPTGLGLIIARHDAEIKALQDLVAVLQARVTATEGEETGTAEQIASCPTPSA